VLYKTRLSVDTHRVEVEHIRQTSLLPAVNAIITEKGTPKVSVSELTQAGYNGDTFLEKYILHFHCEHTVEVGNLLQCSWYFAVIIVTFARTTLDESAPQKLPEVLPYRALSPVPKSEALSKRSRHGITDGRTDHKINLGGPILVQEVEG
jgi:hypothetical protein